MRVLKFLGVFLVSSLLMSFNAFASVQLLREGDSLPLDKIDSNSISTTSNFNNFRFNGYQTDKISSPIEDKYSIHKVSSSEKLMISIVGFDCSIIFLDKNGKVLKVANEYSKAVSRTFSLDTNEAYLLFNLKYRNSDLTSGTVILENQGTITKNLSFADIQKIYKKDDVTIIKNSIIDIILDFFKSLMINGKKIIIAAVGLGVIFIGGKWLWRKTKNWLNNT